MRILLAVLLIIPIAAEAQEAKSMPPQETIAHYEIEIGQLFIANGNLELENAKLKTELAKLKEPKKDVSPESGP